MVLAGLFAWMEGLLFLGAPPCPAMTKRRVSISRTQHIVHRLVLSR